MDCMYCPKRRLCSGSDCYYDYHPELDRELAEDMKRLNDSEENLFKEDGNGHFN